MGSAVPGWHEGLWDVLPPLAPFLRFPVYLRLGEFEFLVELSFHDGLRRQVVQPAANQPNELGGVGGGECHAFPINPGLTQRPKEADGAELLPE